MVLREFNTDGRHYFSDQFGEIQGEFKRWHHNGHIWEHCYYVDGHRHGGSKLWDENGRIWEHCYYANGRRHGERKVWDVNGQLLQHDIWVQGTRFKLGLYDITEKDKFVLNLKYGDFHWLP